MKVLVIGAAGKTGRLVVDRALAAGHKVVALVHSPEEDQKHPLPAAAEVIHGDVQNPSRLEHAMEGCHAVIDALGGKTPWKSTDLERSAAATVLEVMGRTGASRLLVVSVLSAGDSAPQAGFFYEYLMVPTFLHGAIKDKNAMEAEVSASHVDWTLVRPPVLSDSDATGHIRIVSHDEVAHKITRADLAQFLVDQLGLLHLLQPGHHHRQFLNATAPRKLKRSASLLPQHSTRCRSRAAGNHLRLRAPADSALPRPLDRLHRFPRSAPGCRTPPAPGS